MAMNSRTGSEQREWKVASSKPPLAAVINVKATKYEVVSAVAESLGMLVTKDDSMDFDLQWSDSTGTLERFINLKPYQRINHFPGMGGIARKDSLAHNIHKMRKQFPEDYNFIPPTWVLPAQYHTLRAILADQQRRKRSRTFIVKPPNSSQGQGIHLIQAPDQLPKGEAVVVQEYLDKPLLMDGFKFDLRIYVLVTSCDPLKVFLYKDGLVRLSTKAYVPPSLHNLHESFMHLTNYSINKHSETFTKEDSIDRGSKRTLKWFNQWLLLNGHNCVEVWENIADVVIKTLLSVQPQVVHSYQTCRPGVTAGNDTCSFFEILGFDILLDHSLKPWLLEVNRSPSFNTDSQLDLDIKRGVIHDALRLINLRPPLRIKHLSQKKTTSQMRLLSASSAPMTTKSASSSAPFDHTPIGGCCKMYELQRKMAAVKQRLDQLTWQREQEDHESTNMGEYRCIYPPPDPLKAERFAHLLREAARVSLAGTSGLRKKSGSQALLGMKESQLQELLLQFQTTKSLMAQDGSSTGVAAEQGTSSDVDEDYSLVSVNREREAERTQRVMVALAMATPQMDGYLLEDVTLATKAVREEWQWHQPNVATFWLLPGGKERRKKIVQGVFQQVRAVVMSYWGRQNLDTVRLYGFLVKLKSFLLSHGGQGMWSCFSAQQSSWEQNFKSRLEVMSISEFECCRHAVRLCQDAVLAHYHYNCPHQLGSKGSSSTSVKASATNGKSPSYSPLNRTI